MNIAEVVQLGIGAALVVGFWVATGFDMPKKPKKVKKKNSLPEIPSYAEYKRTRNQQDMIEWDAKWHELSVSAGVEYMDAIYDPHFKKLSPLTSAEVREIMLGVYRGKR